MRCLKLQFAQCFKPLYSGHSDQGVFPWQRKAWFLVGRDLLYTLSTLAQESEVCILAIYFLECRYTLNAFIVSLEMKLMSCFLTSYCLQNKDRLLTFWPYTQPSHSQSLINIKLISLISGYRYSWAYSQERVYRIAALEIAKELHLFRIHTCVCIYISVHQYKTQMKTS